MSGVLPIVTGVALGVVLGVLALILLPYVLYAVLYVGVWLIEYLVAWKHRHTTLIHSIDPSEGKTVESYRVSDDVDMTDSSDGDSP